MRVPLTHLLGGSRRFRLGAVARMIVHYYEVRGSEPAGAGGRAIMNVLARLFRLFGVRPLPRAGAWSRTT